MNEPDNCGQIIAVVHELTKRTLEKLFRRLGTIIQSIFCAQSGTSILLTVGNGPLRVGTQGLGFGRLYSKKKHIMLLAVLLFFRNYAKIMLLSENYALCHRNYAT